MDSSMNAGAPDETTRVFVSYAREDKKWLDRDYRFNLIPFLTESLKRQNVVFWFDKDLKPGDEFRDHIEAEIDHHFDRAQQGVGRTIESGAQRRASLRRHGAERVADTLLPRQVGYEVHEIGFAEVAIVVGLLLHPHRGGRGEVLVPVARLLSDLPAFVE